jgi:hypothetical protein
MAPAHWPGQGRQVAERGGRAGAAAALGTPARCSGSRSRRWLAGPGQAYGHRKYILIIQ